MLKFYVSQRFQTFAESLSLERATSRTRRKSRMMEDDLLARWDARSQRGHSDHHSKQFSESLPLKAAWVVTCGEHNDPARREQIMGKAHKRTWAIGFSAENEILKILEM
uniref:(northern house mosquito) hypothetical protein n=1 Tax=Culex pipiens TaxID=7175 RepID=A0A8D8APS8_CULPI